MQPSGTVYLTFIALWSESRASVSVVPGNKRGLASFKDDGQQAWYMKSPNAQQRVREATSAIPWNLRGAVRLGVRDGGGGRGEGDRGG